MNINVFPFAFQISKVYFNFSYLEEMFKVCGGHCLRKFCIKLFAYTVKFSFKRSLLYYIEANVKFSQT